MSLATLILALCVAAPAAEAGVAPSANRAPVLLDFHADWCGPCQKMRPEVRELVRQKVPVRSIDVDEQQELAERYRVEEVPTFLVVDADGEVLARTKGYQPAAKLAGLYLEAKRKADRAAVAAETDVDADADAEAEVPARSSAASQNPRPWETVVRIKIHDRTSVGFGSGTIIHSTKDESIILTCAHIFHVNGARKPIPPEDFPLKIVVDLFDGKLAGPKGQTVYPTGQSFEGEAIDYDFSRDVGLIRIRPGRRLPASPVVTPAWKPAQNLAMFTVGCSEGQPATAWSTKITETYIKGLRDNPNYEAIQCEHAPKRGRSGGGLFTEDGQVAGVCDFAYGDPQFPRGLYATPQSIYRILNRNGLQFCYQRGTEPPDRGRMLARNDEPRRPARSGAQVFRGQNDTLPELKPITIPRPEMLGVPPLAEVAAGESDRQTSVSRRWRPLGEPTEVPTLRQVSREPETSSLRRGGARARRAAEDDTDLPGPPPEDLVDPSTNDASSVGGWRAVK
jgi:thiol-disulfide isomerase/thioredoxin